MIAIVVTIESNGSSSMCITPLIGDRFNKIKQNSKLSHIPLYFPKRIDCSNHLVIFQSISSISRLTEFTGTISMATVDAFRILSLRASLN